MTGEPMGCGSAAFPRVPQGHDHPVVARLRAAGAVVVGLTNLPELAIYPFTDSVYGIARNPWDRRRTPGGSSGGAAAAVAAAMVPLAHGTDGLGSVRIPAAACGLFGIKPGTGVVPGDLGESGWYGLSESGPLTATVADAALMLGVMAGTAYSPAEPGRLRIAASVRPPGPGHRDPPVEQRAGPRVRRAARQVGARGHGRRSALPRLAGPRHALLLVRRPGRGSGRAPGRDGTAHPPPRPGGRAGGPAAPAARVRPRAAARRARAVLRPLRRAGHADAGPSVPARAPLRRTVLAAQRRDAR